MNEEEVANLLGALEQGLIQVGLSSLVNQERIVASEGKAEELTTGDVAQLHLERSRLRTPSRSRAKAGDVRVRPLGPAERLAELLDLVEVAVGGTYAIEVHLRDDFKAALDGDENSWDGHVAFANPPEAPLVGTSPQEWILPDQLTLQQRVPAVREVILLINQIREQAELPRSELLHSVIGPEDSNDDFTVPGDWS